MAHTNWTCDASSALQIALVQANEERKDLKTVSAFSPEFTHSIFGEEESIFGYKGLTIKLRFAAHDLRPNVHISYDERFEAVEDTKPLDLNETLREWLSPESFNTLEEYTKAVLSDESAKDFKPPGELVQTYTTKGRTYEVWAGSLVDPEVRKLFNRIQVLIPFFIDGGQLVETDDAEWTLGRWTIYFLYEKITPAADSLPSYSFAGLATTYRWYFYRRSLDHTAQKSDISFPCTEKIQLERLPSRLRISQFLILQAHRGMGHGSRLYRHIQQEGLNDSSVYELTVEDPNEDFINLRDSNDYRLVKPEFDKLNLKINDNPYPSDMKKKPRCMPTAKLLPVAELEELRVKFKLTPTQFAHVLEMYLLNQIPSSNRGARTNMTRLMTRKWKATNEHERRYYWWRMLVKQRLYKKHRDVMIQADPEERLESLETAVNAVEEGYEQILLNLGVREVELEQERLAIASEGSQEGTGEKKLRARPSKKRIVPDDDEEGDHTSDKSKKIRI